MRYGWLLLGLAAGCNGGEADSDVANADDPTYWRDVRPILDAHCARCHHDDSFAPSFEIAEQVIARSTRIQAYTQSGKMPPPAPDPECADYHGSDIYHLSEASKQVLSDWADAGAPLGDPADAPAPREVTTLGPYDLELHGAQPWTPEFGSDGNAYRCWAFDLDNPSTIYLTGMEAIVDQLAEVHHVVLFRDTTESADIDDADGFDCNGFGENGWDYIHGWGPGSPYLQFADGQGLRIPAQSRLVVQAHYFDTGAPTPDNTGYGLLIADQVAEEVEVLGLGADSFEIPAGEADHQESMNLRWQASYGRLTVLGVWPHMHLFGSGFDMNIAHPDGTDSCIVRSDGYDFHNQVAAMLVQPVEVGPLDEIQLTCHFDNSAGNPNQPNDPPETVEWGEGTEDEMCFGFTYGIFH